MDRITEEDLGVPFIRTLEDHRWDSNYNDIMNFNPTSRGAQRLVWASLREALIVMAAKDARIRELEEGFMRDRVKLLEANNEAWQKVVGELRSRLALAEKAVEWACEEINKMYTISDDGTEDYKYIDWKLKEMVDELRSKVRGG